MGFRRQWLLALSLFYCRAWADYVYKGCFDASGLSLKSLGQYTWQTVSYCEEHCGGSAVVALKNGGECLCGDSVDVLSSAQSGTCDVKCDGWPYATCGGEDSVDVYVDSSLSHSHSSGSSSLVALTSTTTSASSSSLGSSSVASSSGSSVAPSSSTSSSKISSSSEVSASSLLSSSVTSMSSAAASSSPIPSSSAASSSSAPLSSSAPQSSSIVSSSSILSTSSATPTSSAPPSSSTFDSSALSSSPTSSPIPPSQSTSPSTSFAVSYYSSTSAVTQAAAASTSNPATATSSSKSVSLTTSVGYITKVIPTYVTTGNKGKTVYVTTTSVQVSSLAAYGKSANKKSSSMSGGAIAGVVVGVVVGVILIAASILFYLWRRHLSHQEPDIEETKQYQPYSFGDADANPMAYPPSRNTSNWRKASTTRSSSYGGVPTGFLSASSSVGKGSLNSLLNIEDVANNYNRQNLPSTVFEEPPSIYNGNQRFSTGSLPDMMQERNLRVANPDDEANRYSQRKLDEEDEDEDEEDNIFSAGSSGGSYIGQEPKSY